MPRRQFLPSLEHRLSIEASRSENQCSEHAIRLLWCASRMVALHEHSATGVGRAVWAARFQLVPAFSVSCRVMSNGPRCQFLPSLERQLSLEAGRGENQCHEHAFRLGFMVAMVVQAAWLHSMITLPLLLIEPSWLHAFSWYLLSLCHAGRRQAC